jgi:hypothetical protein
MESPIVRKPKARAHLSKPKSQRSPYQKSFSAKLRRRVIVSVHNSKVTNDDVCHAPHLQARKRGGGTLRINKLRTCSFRSPRRQRGGWRFAINQSYKIQLIIHVCYIQILNTLTSHLQRGLRTLEDPYSWNKSVALQVHKRCVCVGGGVALREQNPLRPRRDHLFFNKGGASK